MLPIPGDIVAQFSALLEEKSVPRSHRADYRKRLMYYLDFRAKYPLPDSRSEHVRLFIEKLRPKGQSQQKLEQAAKALSFFYAVQLRKKQHEKRTHDQSIRAVKEFGGNQRFLF